MFSKLNVEKFAMLLNIKEERLMMVDANYLKTKEHLYDLLVTDIEDIKLDDISIDDVTNLIKDCDVLLGVELPEHLFLKKIIKKDICASHVENIPRIRLL